MPTPIIIRPGCTVWRGQALICLIAAAPGCHRPPVGLYEVDSRDGVEYLRRDDKPLHMDIFIPRDAEPPRPAVLWLHGGGWAGGDRSDWYELSRFIASFGYVSATADYRLSKDGACFPDAIHDAAAAVRFLRKNAAEYQLDPDRIAVGGDSAGGHLALMIALANDPELLGRDPDGVPCTVSAVIDVYGPTDLPPLYESNGPLVRSLLEMFLRCKPDDDPRSYAAASPVTHLRSDAPPILIIHGEDDGVVPFAQAQTLYDRCRQVGTPAYLARVPGAGHGWIGQPYGATCQSIIPVIVQFLARVFPEPKGGAGWAQCFTSAENRAATRRRAESEPRRVSELGPIPSQPRRGQT